MEGKVKGSSNAGFQPQHYWHCGWNNSFLSYSLQDVEQIPGLYLLDAGDTPRRAVKTKKVSQSRWLSPSGEEGFPLFDTHITNVSLRKTLSHSTRPFYWLVKKMVPEVLMIGGSTTLFFLAMGQFIAFHIVTFLKSLKMESTEASMAICP